MISRSGRRGFVLIELMAVLAIISILSVFIVPKYVGQLDRARAAQCQANRRSILMALKTYLFDRPTAAAPSLQVLTQQGVLDRLPACTSHGVYVLIDDGSGEPRNTTVACSVHGFATPTQTGSKTLFASHFDSMEGLNSLVGSWTVNDSRLIPGKNGDQILAFGDNAWTDYTIQLTATLTSGSGYGIYYRGDGRPAITGYCFEYDVDAGNKFVVRKVVNGIESDPIASVDMPEGFPIYNTEHTISITVAGSHQRISIDGGEVLSLQDESFAVGSGGLLDEDGSRTDFDDVAVTLN
jgi:general secretion pathway protein G